MQDEKEGAIPVTTCVGDDVNGALGGAVGFGVGEMVGAVRLNAISNENCITWLSFGLGGIAANDKDDDKFCDR
jgi:hypothetical protein